MSRRIGYFNPNGQLVIVQDDGEEEEVEVNPITDSITFTAEITDWEVSMEVGVEFPPSASSNTKGDIGEEAGKYILSVNGAFIEDAELSSYDFQALGFPYRKIDAKISSSRNYSGKEDGHLVWQFSLVSRGTKKDYSKSCDALLCIGVSPDGGIETFLIPSSIPEVIASSKINIPLNWQNSKYAAYHYELSQPAEDYLERLVDSLGL